jgi:hypothetical protein
MRLPRHKRSQWEPPCPASFVRHLERTTRLAAAGRNAKAIVDFAPTLRLNPSDAAARVKVVSVCFRLERVEEGIAALRGALAAEPEHPIALATLAIFAIKTGEELIAREWLRRVRGQVRVPREMAGHLTREYHERFGRASWQAPRVTRRRNSLRTNVRMRKILLRSRGVKFAVRNLTGLRHGLTLPDRILCHPACQAWCVNGAESWQPSQFAP